MLSHGSRIKSLWDGNFEIRELEFSGQPSVARIGAPSLNTRSADRRKISHGPREQHRYLRPSESVFGTGSVLAVKVSSRCRDLVYILNRAVSARGLRSSQVLSIKSHVDVVWEVESAFETESAFGAELVFMIESIPTAQFVPNAYLQRFGPISSRPACSLGGVFHSTTNSWSQICVGLISRGQTRCCRGISFRSIL